MVTISVVSPSYNQSIYLRAAIESIHQSSSVCLEHIVMDGGSDDGSVEILRAYSSLFAYWQTQRDGGQSSAISSGFTRSSGQILTWINSDDGLAPGALDAMSGVLAGISEPAWAIGQCCVIDSSGDRLGLWKPSMISLDDVVVWSRNYIMQPAVFWNRAMHEAAFSLVASLHYAMDFDLWLRFFLLSDPIIVQVPIGIHRTHSDSKTSLVGHRIFDEYRQSLAARLSACPALMRKGLADVASSASRRANASMFCLDRISCLRYLCSALKADLGVIRNQDFHKAVFKLVNPFQSNKLASGYLR